MKEDLQLPAEASGEAGAVELPENPTEAQPPVSTDQRLEMLEADVLKTRAAIDQVESDVLKTQDSLNRIEAALGISPSGKEAPSVAAARENLENLKAKERALLSESEEIRAESGTAVQEMEADPEREAVMERAREARVGLMSKIMESRLASIGLNFIPGVDVAKLSFEAARGKTLSGQELKARNRLNYVLIAGSFAMTYALLLSGQPEFSGVTGTVGGVLAKIEFGPQALNEIAALAREKIPGAARILDAGAAAAARSKETAATAMARCREAAAAIVDNMGKGPNIPLAQEI